MNYGFSYQVCDFFSVHPAKPTLAVLPSIRSHAESHFIGIVVIGGDHVVTAN
jgi:hypothetical protein